MFITATGMKLDSVTPLATLSCVLIASGGLCPWPSFLATAFAWLQQISRSAELALVSLPLDKLGTVSCCPLIKKCLPQAHGGYLNLGSQLVALIQGYRAFKNQRIPGGSVSLGMGLQVFQSSSTSCRFYFLVF